MKLTLVILFTLISLSGFTQTGLISIDSTQLPEKIEIKGDFISCMKWQDEAGLNYLVLSQTKIVLPASAIEALKKYELINFDGKIDTVYSTEADYREKELYACHYVQSADSIFISWKLIDFVKECFLDLTLEYLTETPVITDLDKDGICETWLVYWLGCRSDVSAIDMKLIMHQGKNKYAIRGSRLIRYGKEPDQFDGGAMKMDKAFSRLPKSMNDFALSLWEKYNSEPLNY